jgi:hypothetical protein
MRERHAVTAVPFPVASRRLRPHMTRDMPAASAAAAAAAEHAVARADARMQWHKTQAAAALKCHLLTRELIHMKMHAYADIYSTALRRSSLLSLLGAWLLLIM